MITMKVFQARVNALMATEKGSSAKDPVASGTSMTVLVELTAMVPVLSLVFEAVKINVPT